jgi:hypothetical protein
MVGSYLMWRIMWSGNLDWMDREPGKWEGFVLCVGLDRACTGDRVHSLSGTERFDQLGFDIAGHYSPFGMIGRTWDLTKPLINKCPFQVIPTARA